MLSWHYTKMTGTFSGDWRQCRIVGLEFRFVQNLAYEGKQVLQFKRFMYEVNPLVKYGITRYHRGYLFGLKHCRSVDNDRDFGYHRVFFQLSQPILPEEIRNVQVNDHEIRKRGFQLCETGLTI